jgi:hypothetical protein
MKPSNNGMIFITKKQNRTVKAMRSKPTHQAKKHSVNKVELQRTNICLCAVNH